uniref:Uncharacterized protein n=1 Tax=Oryza sativa subsp. japonica TaxID=39947 RepID=Q658G3_ORYSJ|nr:hypothetical protein [Oryza sativa Japonica Group]BAD72295.1 hypothetical protein [Oryza sativa Japonica Group]
MAASSSLDLSKTMAASGFLIFLLRGPAAPSAVTLRGRSGRGGGGLAFSASSSNLEPWLITSAPESSEKEELDFVFCAIQYNPDGSIYVRFKASHSLCYVTSKNCNWVVIRIVHNMCSTVQLEHHKQLLL